MLATDYYADPNVQARMIEYLGGRSLEAATSAFISSSGRLLPWYDPRPVVELYQCLAEGSEVGRSLWDRASLIVHLDVEYVNFDLPAEPYVNPTRTFDLQRPVVRTIRELLLRHGIAPLHLLSGRGHHFVWQVRRDSAPFARLAWLGRLAETLASRNAQHHPPLGEIVEPDLGSAFAGIGQVLEFFAHCVLEACRHECEVPVELTAVEVGPGRRGREIVSIDLSEYGDPLYTRSIRLPFSAYLKAQRQCDVGSRFEGEVLPLFMIPVHEMDEQQGLVVMRDLGEVKKLARHASVRIPDQSEGTENLVAAYERSALARFHDFFYAADHDPPETWPETYDRTPLEAVPPCAQRILQQPNDLLLKPAGIQHIVRVLLAVGWHPRHIAGLIRSKYERDHGWGAQWYVYDAATRADFYTRLFAGLIATGRDDLLNLNCRSMQEKGYCPVSDCNDNFEVLHSRLDAKETLSQPWFVGEQDSRGTNHCRGAA